MNEWTIVTVLGALVALGAAVVKPLISLNTTITTLTVAVDALQKNVEGLASRNSESHAQLREAIEKGDGRLDNHEIRIVTMEGKWDA